MRGVETGAQHDVLVEILGCNWDAYRTYRLCQQSVLPGGGSAFWLGVSASEIYSALAVVGLPIDRWPDVADQVSDLGDLVAGLLNERAKRRRPAAHRG
jgi:hypothetical protein